LTVHPADEAPGELTAVYGPGLIGVQPLAEFLNIPVWKTTKTLLYQADDRLAAVMVRGDCDVNESKVKRRLGANFLGLASAETIKDLTGAEVGYAGPINLPESVIILADEYTAGRVNFECGANRTDYHYINVNFGRDLPEPEYGDFKQAAAGHFCPKCEIGLLQADRGVIIGDLVLAGDAFSRVFNASFVDPTGASRFIQTGRYTLDLTRLAAAVAEQHHHDRGLAWPPGLAPFDLHLIALNLENDEVRSEAERVYQGLIADGVSVLFDDREARAGEKFGDADLLGLPARLTVSKRNLAAGKLEFKRAGDKEGQLLTEEGVRSLLKSV
jgi:prolyl-tRNA synthetase